MNFDAALNLSLAPHLYEAEAVTAAIEVFESDLQIWHREMQRFTHWAQAPKASKQARAQIKRLNRLIRTCKKGLK